MKKMIRRWTEEEIEILIKMFNSGQTCKSISKTLMRTDNSIISKLNKLGLKTGKGKKPFKYEAGQKIYNIEILKQERKLKNKKGHTGKGYIVLVDGNKEIFIWESNLNKLKKPYNRSNFVDESNWLYSEKWMFDFIKNKEELKKVSKSSNKSLSCICKHCGNEDTFTASYLYNKGFNCTICGDTNSFNNRFMKSILLYNKEEFRDEKTFKGCENIRKLPFDFYLPNKNMVIEMHGKQHYTEIEYFKNSLETVKNDKIKREYCLNKGIDLVEIDCSSGDVDVIVENIMRSKLGDFLIISKDIFYNFRSNPMNEKLISLYLQKKPMSYIAKEFDIHESTVIKRLRRLGVEIRKNNKRIVRCINTGKEFYSIKEACEWCGYKSSGGISEACNINSNKKYAGKHPVTGEPLKWEYVDNK